MEKIVTKLESLIAQIENCISYDAILGVITFGACLVGIFIFTVLYFAIKKKFVNGKYTAEILIVSLATIINIIIKVFVIFHLNSSSDSSLDEKVYPVTWFFAIYETLGGFSFEGLRWIEEMSSGWQCLYLGSSIFNAICFVFVVTFKTSYEIASRVASCVYRLVSGRDVYIFTALTDDTLALARSISDTYSSDKKCKKDKNQENNRSRKCLICFTGEEIPAFDKKNELCREVMASGYYYWSGLKNIERKGRKSKSKSLIKSAHIYNIKKGKKSKFKSMTKFGKNCVVLAFSKNEPNLPKKEINLDIVLRDVEKRIKNKDNSHINYIILNEKGINYEAYDRIQKELIYKCYETDKERDKNEIKPDEFEKYVMSSNLKKDTDFGIKTDKREKCSGELSKYKEKLSGIASFEVWDESVVGSRVVIKNVLEKTDIYKKIVDNNNPQKDVVVWALGFGESNQELTKQLFSQLSYINQNGQPNGYEVHAFDNNMENIAGLYGNSHPLCPYAEVYKTGSPELDMAYAVENAKTLYEKTYSGLGYNEEIVFPKYYFEKLSCLESEFYSRLDAVTGKNDSSYETRPDILLISVGDDSINIKLANTIMRDISLEGNSNKGTQIIVVNIRDKRNISSLESANGVWKENVLEGSGFTVIVINVSELYTYENVLDNSRAVEYANAFYKSKHHLCKLASNYLKYDEDLKKVLRSIKLVNGSVAEQLIHAIYTLPYFSYVDEKVNLWRIIHMCYSVNDEKSSNSNNKSREWENISLWEKEFNKRAAQFNDCNSKYYINGNVTLEEYVNFGKLQHQRGIRDHIGEGWVPSHKDHKSKDELTKRHVIIKPFNELDSTIREIEFANVQLALEDIQKK